MIPIFDTLMINSKRKADYALAVYCVNARLDGGFFFKKHPYKDKTTKSKYEKIHYI